MVRSHKLDPAEIMTRRAHQVFCKSSGNFAMFTAIRRASSAAVD
jgi:hypothetical protein